MTDKVYCRDCGVVESSHFHHGCSVCGQDVYATIPAHITAMQARIAELEKVAEAAAVLARDGIAPGYTSFYEALRDAGFLKEQG